MRDGAPVTMRAKHLVMALGLSGCAKAPAFPGLDLFQGPQFHYGAYHDWTGFAGRDVIVVGANNSAHDIASDLLRCGARPTRLQRPSSLVVRQDDYCERVLGPP
jgi:putative flavoprotein involved in K+ transport